MPKYQKQFNLLSAICKAEIERRELTPRDFAHVIGYSIGYTDSLLNGARPWRAIEKHKMYSVAHFLDTSLVDALLLAGILDIGDFIRAEERGGFDYENDSLKFRRVYQLGTDAWILLPSR